MGNFLTFLELTAVACWFGGSLTSGPDASRWRRLFVACGAAVAVVGAARAWLWGFTPPLLGAALLPTVFLAGLRWWARWPGILFGLVYLGWVAWRGY
jgi:hypothetical protein